MASEDSVETSEAETSASAEQESETGTSVEQETETEAAAEREAQTIAVPEHESETEAAPTQELEVIDNEEVPLADQLEDQIIPEPATPSEPKASSGSSSGGASGGGSGIVGGDILEEEDPLAYLTEEELKMYKKLLSRSGSGNAEEKLYSALSVYDGAAYARALSIPAGLLGVEEAKEDYSELVKEVLEMIGALPYAEEVEAYENEVVEKITGEEAEESGVQTISGNEGRSMFQIGTDGPEIFDSSEENASDAEQRTVGDYAVPTVEDGDGSLEWKMAIVNKLIEYIDGLRAQTAETRTVYGEMPEEAQKAMQESSPDALPKLIALEEKLASINADDLLAMIDTEGIIALLLVDGEVKQFTTLQGAVDAADGSDAVIHLVSNVEENITIDNKNIDIDMNNYSIKAAEAGSVINISDANVTIKNGTVTGGTATNTVTDMTGGAIGAEGGSLTLENVTLSGNSALQGSALYGNNTNFTLKKVTLSENPEVNQGSGGKGITYHYHVIYAIGGTFDMTDSEFTGNSYCVSGGNGYYGGSILLESVPDAQISNTVFSDNGVYVVNLSGSTSATLDHVDFVDNVNVRNVLRVEQSASVVAENCTFVRNTGGYNSSSNSGGIIVLLGSGDKTFRNCEIKENSSAISYSHAVTIQSSNSGKIIFEKCSITDNQMTASSAGGNSGGIYNAGTGNVDIIGGVIKNNSSAGYGVLAQNGSSSMTVSETVIKDNAYGGVVSNYAGGVYANKGTFTMTSGALYNNTPCDFARASTSANYSLLSASAMVDDELGEENLFQKYGYVWKPSWTTTVYKKGISSKSGEDGYDYISTTGRFSTIATEGRNVAKIVKGEETTVYTSLSDAVAAAEDGDTIEIIIGEEGLSPSIDVEAPITIPSEKKLTVVFNGCRISAPYDSRKNNKMALFDVKGSLTLKGAAEINGRLIIEANGEAVLDADVRFTGTRPSNALYDNINATGENSKLTINGNAAGLTVKTALSKGQGIIAGEGFTVSNGKLTMLVDVSSVAILMEGKENVPLIHGCNDDRITETITLKTSSGGSFSDKSLSIRVSDDKKDIVLHKESMDGVYLDGTQRKDINNSGLEYQKPVGTFAKALEIARENNLKRIYVIGTVTVKESMTLSTGSNDIRVMRYPGPASGTTPKAFADALFKVTSGATLTLSDIVIDGANAEGITSGGKASLSSKGALVEVDSGSKLILNAGAVLQNNNVTSGATTKCDGGAIYLTGTLEMNEGSRIEGCYAKSGGAIMCYGSFTMNGGEIIGNYATGAAESSGGGILVQQSGRMIMNDGLIQDNHSYHGGGISVGRAEANVIWNQLASGQETFVMHGGRVDANRVTDYVPKTGTVRSANGGGIFVQATYIAEITGGYITNNVCDNKARYGGGGIYVNDGKGASNGDKASGLLKLENVLIADNEAPEGEGVFCCPTSNARIYLKNGAVIYTDNESKSKICVNATIQSTSGGLGGFYKPHVIISNYMLGGGSYNWTNSEGEEYLINQYGDVVVGGHNDFYTKVTGDNKDAIAGAALAKVQITGNTSNSTGGGISNNGDIEIGTPEPVLRISKNIEGNAAKVHQMDTFQIRVTLINEGAAWTGNAGIIRTKDGSVLTRDGETVSFAGGVSYTENGEKKTTNPGEAILNIDADEIILLSDMPVGCEYTVEEIDTKNAIEVSMECTGHDGSKDLYKKNGNIITGTILDAKFGTIVTITNTYDDGGFSVSKTVYGDEDEKTNDWQFTITLTTADNQPYAGAVRYQKAGGSGISTLNLQYLFLPQKDSGSDTAQGQLTAENGKITFTLKDGETYYFNDLPVGTKYKVEETEANQNGYTTKFYLNGTETEAVAGVIEKDASVAVNCVNTQHIDIPVKKIWKDQTGKDLSDEQLAAYFPGQSLPSVTVELLRQVKISETELSEAQVVGTSQLSSTNGWKITFENLPVEGDDGAYVYTIRESGVPEGWAVAVAGTDRTGFTVTNTYVPEPVKVTVNKYWADAGYEANRPTSVTVQLTKDGVNEGESIVLDASNDWTHDWENLEKGPDWEVVETSAPAGYTASVETKVDEASGDVTVEITNTYTPPTTPPPPGDNPPPPGDNPPPPSDNPPPSSYNPPPSTTTERTSNNPTTPTTPITNIPDEPTPLSSFETILDEDVPLAFLAPMTGDEKPVGAVALLGLMAVGLMGVFGILSRKKEDES